MIEIGASRLEFRAILSCLYHRDNEIISLLTSLRKATALAEKAAGSQWFDTSRGLTRHGAASFCVGQDGAGSTEN
jgi:hypothetical protein